MKSIRGGYGVVWKVPNVENVVATKDNISKDILSKFVSFPVNHFPWHRDSEVRESHHTQLVSHVARCQLVISFALRLLEECVEIQEKGYY